MTKRGLSVAALVAVSAGAAHAADLRMAYKAPPPVIVSPWDVAFGASIASDYVFRGITQSNHKPGVAAYIEPRFNVNPNLQLYAGLGGASISFLNRAAAEIDIYGGIRPTFGPLALDFGAWYYAYPGGQCIDATIQAITGPLVCPPGSANVPNLNAMKKDVSFFEVYAKGTYTFNEMFAIGATAFYTPSFLHSGADGTYISATAKFTGPALANGIGWYVSGEIGQQYLGTTDTFYSIGTFGPASPLAALGINYSDYTTWNIGIGFTYKVFTLDLRYSGTDLSRGDCNAFTGDFTAFAPGPFVTPINPGGAGSNWCGDTFIAKLSVDTSLSALK